MSRRPEKIAVVGRDAAAWTVAFGLQRAFGRVGVAVTVVDLPSLLGPADVCPALPTLGGLHRLLGLDEREVLASAAGVHALGQRFVGWSGGQGGFLHAYDSQPIGLNSVDFLQYWVKGRGKGLALELDEFSLGAAGARHGRLVTDAAPAAGLPRPAHGYHLHARGYVDLLRRKATASGATCVSGALRGADVADGRIAAVVLEDGTRVEADLFVDATGAEAALIGRLPGDAVEDWGQWLGCDRVLTASAPRLDPLPGYSQIAAFDAGWLGLYPLQDRTAVVAVYDHARQSDAQMLQTAAALSGLALQGDATVAPFRAGFRPRPWIGNCVAIGEGAVSLEPLDAAPMHVVQVGLSHLIALFPVGPDFALETEAYNAAIASHAGNLRDFQIAHYKLNGRSGEPFWDRARDRPAPETLAYKLKLFAGRGRVALYDDEAFQEPSWTSIFVGHGLIPRDYDPLVEMVGEPEQVRHFQNLLRLIAAEVRQAPTIAARLARP
ncbi:tryptophan 7-halogenase [Caulobacter sp. 17J80-11]|uniref:tryptophan 7-halogenase n=1 Tax=Caulobacter sp. 17J80-11 TaxID=2763502 RepID=UPI0016539573|nr:tryptophan 7-halogenase [Caulobacter sp. 17J80-11]MBC6983414.1 tryptophan 7-halogenase [Caulobacter sp. 17J80-11]